MILRASAWLAALALLAGCSAADQLDCGGIGTVYGQYRDVNIGNAELRYGAAWGSAELGYGVVLSSHRGYAEALQRSARPLFDSERAAELLGLVTVGAVYDTGGDFVSYFASGKGSSRGTSSGYSGSLVIDDEGCARGNFSLYDDRNAVFALPQWRPENVRLYAQGPEGGEVSTSQAGGIDPPDTDDPLQVWAALHAQLVHPDPARGLIALGLSVPVAEHLANDPAALRALERLRTQCPDPARAKLNEWGEVEGPSTAAPDITLSGWVSTEIDEGRLRLRMCSVSTRNGESVEQCLPLQDDCRQAPLWRPDS